MKFLNLLLLAIPISILLRLMDYSPVLLFVAASLSIIPLSGYMGKATEEIAIYVGPRVGGLLNATFGNAAELIITIFALRAGLAEVVKASITGSIIGNLLLVLGLSMLLGGFKFKTQKFNRAAAGMHTSMLLMAVTGLIIPAVFINTHTNPAAEPLSLGVATVLMLIYLLSLIFSLHTHKDVFRPSLDHSETPKWSKLKALLILLIATFFVVIESEFLVGGIEPVVKTLGISELFIGVIVIPIIGNAAEHSTSVMMALKNKMEISLEIAIGSSTQIALFVAPLLVFIGYFMGRPLDLLFTGYELIVIIMGTVITAMISMDGRSNWLEGAQLLAAYAIMALAFLFV
ncbi:calcium/proton exchanger [Desulfosporosinus sp. Sb-LF]|uniref:calcium/proton exchanger n=1 Tax=Desulfosporosinus sp. Sb-LF TaxID=2560027 RepID=UPI00107F3417|nr:calcium/proton exchanger [Desulfosporosinus sp. Sb-LF]TGE33637.1 calcium/proton exchanger [Desulfosporosinus sp. Sb-LF]